MLEIRDRYARTDAGREEERGGSFDGETPGGAGGGANPCDFEFPPTFVQTAPMMSSMSRPSRNVCSTMDLMEWKSCSLRCTPVRSMSSSMAS